MELGLLYLLSIAVGLLFVSAVTAASLGKRISASIYLFLNVCASLAIFGASLLGWYRQISWTLPLPLAIGGVPFAFHCDTLSSAFMLPLGLVALCCAYYCGDYFENQPPQFNLSRFWASYSLCVGGMLGTLLSANAICFLVCWELMALSSVSLVLADSERHDCRRAALMYLASTRIATALLTVGFILMYAKTGSWNFADWSFSGHGTAVASILILLGFCVKAGIWPFHIWLPHAYHAAPAPVSALLSGALSKVSIYGVIRVLVLGGTGDSATIAIAFSLACVSSFWGILFALVQQDLKKVLAFSSVENLGLILMAISVSLYARASGHPLVAGMALLAAIFHSLNHSLIKTSLFLGAGAVECRAHSLILSRLGGLVQKMHWTAPCFLVAAAAICALPPLNGFCSKWFLYQSLLRTVWDSPSLVIRTAGLLAIGGLSLVGAMSIACFSKAFGIVFLGRPRTHVAASTREASFAMVMPQVLLTFLCLMTGFMSPFIVQCMSPIAVSMVDVTELSAVGSALFVDNIPMPGMFIVTTGLFVLIYVAVLRRKDPARKSVTWDCGFGELSARTESSGESFSQPIARIFSSLLGYSVTTAITGADRRHFPERIEVAPSTTSLLEQRVYRPLIAGLQGLAKVLARLQAGSIHLYLLYVCITLVALLVLGTRI